MRRFNRKRQLAISHRMSEAGKKSQAAQRARRESEMTPELLMALRANPAPRKGDVIRVMEWRNIQDGSILRWAVLRGPRCNNYALRSPDGRTSRPHGMAWILDHLRPILLTH